MFTGRTLLCLSAIAPVLSHHQYALEPESTYVALESSFTVPSLLTLDENTEFSFSNLRWYQRKYLEYKIRYYKSRKRYLPLRDIVYNLQRRTKEALATFVDNILKEDEDIAASRDYKEYKDAVNQWGYKCMDALRENEKLLQKPLERAYNMKLSVSTTFEWCWWHKRIMKHIIYPGLVLLRKEMGKKHASLLDYISNLLLLADDHVCPIHQH